MCTQCETVESDIAYADAFIASVNYPVHLPACGSENTVRHDALADLYALQSADQRRKGSALGY